ncbi:MAG: TIGR04211 family SH3 domain-containing protein, partial [Desulfobacteraceae bacterium]|nr:TIGR04211 family SH3 domain-containing protein [Desulfobacteraceae bacterium]
SGVSAYTQPRTGYVSDMLILTFREGPGSSYQVLKTLESNTPLEIMDEENGYFRVQLSSGETGWVDQQFVMFDTPKVQIIAQLEQEKQVLETQLQELTADQDTLTNQAASQTTTRQQEISTLKAALEKAQEQNSILNDRLAASQKQYETLAAASEDVLEVMEENKTLEAQNNQLSRDIALLEDASGKVLKTGMIKWFLAGFGVIFLGWILGQSVSSSRRKNNSLLG